MVQMKRDPIKTDSTKDIDIDYAEDRHLYIRVCSKVLEILGWD